MTSMLADVINYGTAYKARSEGFTLPAAGKTGTTNDFVDAWFVGFTPKLVSGVWIGFDQPRTIIANGFAGDLAVPLWAHFMKAATAKDKPDWYRPPPGVVTSTICAAYLSRNRRLRTGGLRIFRARHGAAANLRDECAAAGWRADGQSRDRAGSAGARRNTRSGGGLFRASSGVRRAALRRDGCRGRRPERPEEEGVLGEDIWK